MALEYAQNCENVANVYAPDPVTFLVYQLGNDEFKVPAEIGDIERLYKTARYYEIMQANFDLLGRIHQRSGDAEKSLYCSNCALEAISSWDSCRYYLVSYFGSSDEVNNVEISTYLSQINISDMIDKRVKILLYSNRDGSADITGKQIISLCSTLDVATYLSNRAMSELSLKYYAEAISDCNAALEIWEQMPYSERSNLSCTYICLALANIMPQSRQTEKFSPKDKSKIIGYLSSAVSYDKELYGGQHPRTAYSLEARGFAYLILEDSDKAIDDYISAYRIFMEIGDDRSVKGVKESLKQVYEIEYGSPDGFEEWMESLL